MRNITTIDVNVTNLIFFNLNKFLSQLTHFTITIINKSPNQFEFISGRFTGDAHLTVNNFTHKKLYIYFVQINIRI